MPKPTTRRKPQSAPVPVEPLVEPARLTVPELLAVDALRTAYDGAVAHVPVARPLRPEGMAGAPQGAALDPAQAMTFTADVQAAEPPSGAGRSETTDASRAKRRGKGKAALAETPRTAHSGSAGTGESI